jgi:hypothetical protein
MSISLEWVSNTGTEPLALDDVKNFLRVDSTNTEDDVLITGLITAARERAETITGRSLITSNWIYWIDSFPYGWQLNTGPARNTINRFQNWWAENQVIQIPKAPLQSVTSVQYMPSYGGDYVTLDSSLYTVDTASNPGCISPVANYYWPFSWTIRNAVQIEFTAGYTDSFVPETILTAMRLLITDWYENRGDHQTTNNAASILLKGYKSSPVGYTDR